MVLHNLQLNTLMCVSKHIPDGMTCLIHFYKHTRVTVVNSICSDSIITMLYLNELKRDRSYQVLRLWLYVVITGNVGLIRCCFSLLIGTIQSTFTPTEECTWQYYVSRMWTSSWTSYPLGAADVLAGCGPVYCWLQSFVDGISLCHPCMAGSLSGGFASSACVQMQHC